MAFFGETLLSICEEYVKTNSSQNADLCAQLRLVASYTKSESDTKKFLSDLKKILQTKSLPNLDLLLAFLVPLYLSISNKNAAKKVLSSFFQGLAPEQRDRAKELLCQRVRESCEVTAMEGSSCEGSVRHIVDVLAALMENFSLGELCITSVALTALEFLARCQEYFFRLFREGGRSAMQVNVLMHDCHVTMQVLNRLSQRHLPRDRQHLPLATVSGVMRTNMDIMIEEQMMVDCRCCCAINLVLLLQIAEPDLVLQIVNSSLGLSPLTSAAIPSWLDDVRFSRLSLTALSPLSSLALLWGFLSMLDTATVTMVTSVVQTTHDHDGETEAKKAADVASGQELSLNSAGNCSEKITAEKASGGTDLTTAGDVEKRGEGGRIGRGEQVAREATAGNVEKMGEGGIRGGGGGDNAAGDDGRLLACEVVLRKLLTLDKRCQTSASRVQCIKTVNLWTARMLSCVKEVAQATETCGRTRVLRRLRGEGDAVQRLLNFVWTHWQDQLDAMRQNSRIIFDNCLKMHLLAAQPEDAASDPFLLSLLAHILDLEWTNHGKCSALVSLVGCMGTGPLLQGHPHFPSTLLAQAEDPCLACHVSELYEVLISRDKERVSGTHSGVEGGGGGGDGGDSTDRAWLSVWVDPVITQLCSNNKKLKQHIIEYVLPRVMKKDKSVLEHMLHKLSSSRETGGQHLGALTVCLRRARAWGLMSEVLQTQDSAAPVWLKIHAALSGPEEQVRLDAFALLCESKRTSAVVSRVEFHHLQHFITFNLNNQSPAFRQAMLAFIKKLFFRVNESQLALVRLRKRKDKEQEANTALGAYSSFLSWLLDFLFTQLYPSAAFARRTMSLAILALLVQDVRPDGGGFNPLGEMGDNHVHSLLESLTDTFEENKREAFALLAACTAYRPDLLKEEKCKALYSVALELAVSTRPQDCGTAAYVFKLLLRQPCARALLSSQQPLVPRSTSTGQHSEASEVNAEPPNQIYQDLLRVKKLMMEIELEEESDVSGTLLLMRALLELLVDQVTMATSSLILAAANRPIYPTLHCVRYILDDIDFRLLAGSEQEAWRRCMECLLQVCLLVAAIVSPVVQNSSPEGNIPEEAIMGPGLKFDVGLMSAVEESRQTVTLMPEYLVVCCWRSIKEVSLLLGQLSLHVPISTPDAPSVGLFSLSQVEQIGAYFKQQLMESLHRGAFELAYAGFVLMCQMLWKSPCGELGTMPRRWLEGVMSAIACPDESTSLCATRRSAGVPFFIQAIVATEPTSSGRPSFQRAITQLLQLALAAETDPHSTNTDGQVHSLNILRALFKDSRLGEDVAPYVSDGLKAAVLGFKSQFWEIRNSATLLLSALMTRIFGVKRSKDENVLSKRNSQTGRAFFHKYPSLYQFLLAELEMATQNLGSSGHLHLHPSLYPVLMVLGRLFPSTMEGASTLLNLAAFIPHVIKCSSSPVYKTRMMAARALRPLAGKEQLTAVMTALLTSLPPSPTAGAEGVTSLSASPTAGASPLPHSHIHGILLQVYHLLQLSGDMTTSLLHGLAAVCVTGWLPVVWLITRSNPCLCTRKVALEVTDLMVVTTSPVATSLPADCQRDLNLITQCLRATLTSELPPLSPPLSPPPSSSPHYSPHTPFLSELLSTVVMLSMKYLCGGEAGEGEGKGKGEGEGKEGKGEGEDVVLRLLSIEAYEVHLAVVETLMRRWTEAQLARGQDETKDSNSRDISQQRRTGPKGSDSDEGFVMTPEVLLYLLDMGLREGGHTETTIKIFELLSSYPSVDVIKERRNCGEVFVQLLSNLQAERRWDVRAPLIQFSGCLFPSLYEDICRNKADSKRWMEALQQWSRVLADSCVAEQPDDLHLSCAGVLRDNCRLMLADPSGCLGLLVFDFWALLVTLLQADDLEVKDVVASVSANLGSPETGGSHCEQALSQVICTMFALHGTTQAFPCLQAALSWIIPQDSGSQDGTERLFDKGELNTFQDSVALARTVSAILQQMLRPEDLSHRPGDVSMEKALSSLSISPRPPSGANQDSRLCVRLSEREEQQLLGIIQQTLALAEADGSVTRNAQREFPGSLFLSGSCYSDATVLLLQLVILIAVVKNVPDLSARSDELKAAYQRMVTFVRSQVQRNATSNYLLGGLVSAL